MNTWTTLSDGSRQLIEEAYLLSVMMCIHSLRACVYIGDMDVQFFWSFVSIDLDEDVAEQLLEEIVRLAGKQFEASQQLQHTWKITKPVLLRKQRNLLDSEKGSSARNKI